MQIVQAVQYPEFIPWFIDVNSTEKGQFIPKLQEKKTGSSTKDEQRETMHNTQPNYNIKKCAVEQFSHTNATAGFQILWLTFYNLSITINNTFTNTKPDPTLCSRWLTRCGKFNPGHWPVQQFTLVLTAKSQRTMIWIKSSYLIDFPVNWFQQGNWFEVCGLTWYNWFDCTHHTDLNILNLTWGRYNNSQL